MASKVNKDFLSLARTIAVVSTGALAFLGVIVGQGETWVWIVASVLFLAIVLLEVLSYRWERIKSNRLGPSHEFVLGRVIRLIADLSNLTARAFDLWVIDLYLPEATWLPKRTVCNLSLSLHIALTDVRAVPSEIKLDHAIFGRCFSERRSELWWDVELAPTSDENLWEQLNDNENDSIRKQYGIMSVNPLIDNVRKDCRGLLVVHAIHDDVVVRKVKGALTAPEGKRRIAAACLDIHNHLQANG